VISTSLVFIGFDNFPSKITAILWVISINSSKSWDKTIIDVPFLERSIRDSLMECSAPASMPQVGWEIIKSLGFDDISLPMTNFCKFPPERLEAFASDPGVTTLKFSITLIA